MSAILNAGSLILGILSWAIPVAAIKKHEKGERSSLGKFSICSFTACMAALVFQLFEIRYRINIGDTAGVADTIGTVSAAAVIMCIITIIINFTANAVCTENEK